MSETAEQSEGRIWTLITGRALDLLVFGLLMAAVVVNHPGFFNDDLWITFRCAENLRAGEGLVFNVGEPVLGTTAPAYAVFLALLSFPLGGVPMAGLVLGWLGFAVMGIGLYLVCEQERRGSGFCGLLAMGFMSLDACMKYQFGMESHLATGLGFLAVWLHLRHRQTWLLGVVMALMVLMRPDAVFLGAVLALSAALNWRIPWWGIVSFAAIIGVWCLFAIPFYGSPIPGTVAAKSQLGQSATFPFQFMTLLFEKFYTWYWSAYHMLWIGLLGLLAGAAQRSLRAPTLLLAWIVFHYLGFAAARVEAFSWYYIPIFATLYFGMAMWPLLASVAVNRHWFDLILRVGLVCASVKILTVAIAWAPHADTHAEPLTEAMQGYRDMGEWLRENGEPDDVLATIEIGVLGHFSGMRILDLRGLVTPETLEHLARGDAGWWTRRRPLPRFVVINRPPWNAEGVDLEFMARNYRPVMRRGNKQLFMLTAVDHSSMSDEEILARFEEAVHSRDVNELEALALHFQTQGQIERMIEVTLALFKIQEPTQEQVAQIAVHLLGLSGKDSREEWVEALIEPALRVGDLETLLSLADACYARADFWDALRLLERAAELAPEAPGVQFDLGRALWRNGMHVDGLVALEPLFDHGTIGLWAHRTAALIHEDLGNLDSALKHWEVCLGSGMLSLEREATGAISRLSALPRKPPPVAEESEELSRADPEGP